MNPAYGLSISQRNQIGFRINFLSRLKHWFLIGNDEKGAQENFAE